MRIFLFIILLTTGQLSFSQEKKPSYSQEFSFTNDNDAYLPVKMNGHYGNKDGYYTDGDYIYLDRVLLNHRYKTIAQYELGQMIFTPISLTYYRLHGIDRPFCGYLYVRYGRSTFFSDSSVLHWDAQLGTTGPNSLGEQTQLKWHSLLNKKKFIGWENQIGNEISLNAHIGYINTVWQPSKYFKLMLQEDGNLGNAFINVKMGAYVCVGLFEGNQSTELLHSSIGTTATQRKHKHELFAYWFPQYILQGYNATVQGSMFSKYTHSVTEPLEPFMYQQTWGLLYAKSRCSLKLEIVYQTKECTTQLTPQRYGSFCFGYKFY